MSSQTDGTKTVTVNYMGTNTYAKSTNQTTYQSNKKITEITVGSTKSIYVGDKVSVYGKLSARGIGLAYKNVTIDVKGVKYYTTTSKYGNYNLKVVANNQGYNTITATYAGTNIYASDSATTYFQANKKVTTITVGSTSSVNLGNSISIYGKLSARGIGLAYKTVTIDVEGDTYTTTTSKYGNYKITVPTYYEGYNTITASYAGTNIYTSDSASTYVNVHQKYKVVTLSVGTSSDWTVKDIDGDPFVAHYTTYYGQYDPGVYAEIDCRGLEYSPINKIITSKFYFKNIYGNIITRTAYADYLTATSTNLISGYTPYKVEITYCPMTEEERYNYWYGYQ